MKLSSAGAHTPIRVTRQPSFSLTRVLAARRSALLAGGAGAVFFFVSAAAPGQQAGPPPVVVQPGAPGAPSQRLPNSTRALLPPQSAADAQFVRDMIVHHAQAIEMTAMIASHSEDANLKSLGERIRRSQTDEIRFMKHWLGTRGEPTVDSSRSMPGMNMPQATTMLMPGMLSPEQMDRLRQALGGEFDRLFLAGMIQHHQGALTMVQELFDTPGAGQDAELFNFASDADNTQRAEIRIMQDMLAKKKSEEQR